jgi:DUF4097 and DUF4098 domain-containing protein YvlB
MNASRVLAGLFLGLVVSLPAMAVERIVEMRVDGSVPVRIENLVGRARIVPGDGELVVRATISAERQDLADAVQVRRINGRDGVSIFIDYPDEVSRIRYDGDEFRRIDASVEYQGRKIRVASSRGERVRVDLEILVPSGRALRVTQAIGGIEARDVRGNLALVTRYGAIQVADAAGELDVRSGSGRISVAAFRGPVKADTGSGAVELENILGRIQAETGSGSVGMRGIDGDVTARTGSGGVRLSDLTGTLDVRTGSGSVRVERLTAGADLSVATGSGGVSVAGDLAAAGNIAVRTGSGSVRLESSTPMSLRLELSTGSGSFKVDVPSLSDVESGRRSFRAQVGAGDGFAKVSTGSGSIRIQAP